SRGHHAGLGDDDRGERLWRLPRYRQHAYVVREQPAGRQYGERLVHLDDPAAVVEWPWGAAWRAAPHERTDEATPSRPTATMSVVAEDTARRLLVLGAGPGQLGLLEAAREQ